MFWVKLICGPYISSSVGDKGMTFGTDVPHMALLHKQPVATKNSNVFKMAANFKNGYRPHIRFGL